MIGMLSIELHYPHSHSLKEKRMEVRAIKDRLRRRFNVSVAETGYQELWQRAVLTAVTVGSERRGLQEVLEAMARDLEERHPSELLDVEIELLD